MFAVDLETDPVPSTKQAKKARLWKKWYGKVGGVKVKCPKCVVYVVRPKANEHEVNHHSPGLPEACTFCQYRYKVPASGNCNN